MNLHEAVGGTENPLMIENSSAAGMFEVIELVSFQDAGLPWKRPVDRTFPTDDTRNSWRDRAESATPWGQWRIMVAQQVLVPAGIGEAHA